MDLVTTDGDHLSWFANHFQINPRNAGLLDGVKIGSPTRTRVTPGNTASVGDTIVG